MYYVYRKGLTDGRNSYDKQFGGRKPGRGGRRNDRSANGGARQNEPRPAQTTGPVDPLDVKIGLAAAPRQPRRNDSQQGPRRDHRGRLIFGDRVNRGNRGNSGVRQGGRPEGQNGRSRFGNGGGGGRRGNNKAGIDITKYINKDPVAAAPVVAYEPEHRFEDFNVEESLKRNIVTKGYINPTPIQDKAIPRVLEGSDVVGIANTGTGKTAAFLVPLIDKVLKDRKERILIVAPTRELAIQIDDEFKGFSKGFNMFSACIVGGANIGKQISELRRGVSFVIGTPGRIKDLVERRNLDLSAYRTIVLDEADRMLDMGFVNDMRFLMARMPKPRHTLLFTATLSPDIRNLVGEFLTNPVIVEIANAVTPKAIHQDIIEVFDGENKLDKLHDLLSNPEFNKVIIFGRTKHGVEKLSKLLSRKGHAVESIHGNKNLNRRQRALTSFKENKIKALIATDVAARGLDISDVSHVINYDAPATYEDYVHRIGRTGRAGKGGKALTFVERNK